MHRWSCHLVLAVVCLTVVAGVIAVPSAGQVIAQTDDEDLDAQRIVITVDVAADGTAVWTVEHRYRLEDDATATAFEDLAADIEANPAAYTDRFEERLAGTVDAARSATDRDMSIENVTVAAETRALPQDYGIVEYRFVWHGFAAVEDESIHAGDAIAGFFLDDVTRLRITWPDGYALDSVEPTPDDQREGSVVWEGPTDFDTDEPRLTVRPTAASDDDPAPGTDDETVAADRPVTLYGAIAAILLLALVLAWWRWGMPTDIDRAGDDGDGARPGSRTDVPEALLSNEEKVLRLVAENGGRIKQKAVTEAFDWSDANTSQVVRDLREEGKVETFRIGRENVIVLPEEAEEGFP